MLDVVPESSIDELLVSVPFVHTTRGAVSSGELSLGLAVIKEDVMIVLFPLPVIDAATVASLGTIIPMSV